MDQIWPVDYNVPIPSLEWLCGIQPDYSESLILDSNGREGWKEKIKPYYEKRQKPEWNIGLGFDFIP